MRNADSPAMPTLKIEEYKCSEGLPVGCFQTKQRTVNHNGLTKREMFAMHAPSDIPEWFKSSFIKSNYSNKDLVASFTALAPESARLSFDGEMALLKAWRYLYADLMLGEE